MENISLGATPEEIKSISKESAISKKQVLAASLVGNMLEFYDFSLYGIFAPLLATLFFPTKSPIMGLLASLATFGVGFFMRPLGGIVFGHIGDRLGRKKALTLSILLMAFPTCFVGLLPTYEQIGVLAPIALIFCRLLQGLCAGGEYSGAAIFTIEHLSYKSSGLSGSLVSASGAVGALIASSLGAFFLQSWMPQDAWRLPFLLGGVLGIVGFYIRRHIAETPDFKKSIASVKKDSSFPLLQAIKNHPKMILSSIAFVGFSGSLSYTLVAYMNIYLHKVVGLIPSQSMLYNSLGLLFYVIICPIAGFLSDKVGHRKMMLRSAILLIVSIYPLFLLLHHATLFSLALLQLLFCTLAAGFIAPVNALLNTLFPTHLRYSGIAFSYSMGVAVFGGAMPFYCTLLIEITHNPMMPAFYLMFCGGIALIGLINLGPIKQKDIHQQLAA